MPIPLAAFAPDVADYNVEVARVADNCISLLNGYRQLPVASTPGNQATMTGFGGNFATVRGHRRFNPSEASGEWMTLIAGQDTSNNPELWTLSAAHANTDIMGATTNLSPTEPWPSTRAVFVDWDDDLFIFGNWAPQTISNANISAGLDDAGTTNTDDLAGSPPGARYAARVRQQLVLGYTYESATSYPHRLWWSAFGDPTGWTSGTNQAGFEDSAFADGGDIVGIVGGEYGLVFQQRKITRMNYIGSPDIWEFDVIGLNEGTYADGSIVQAGGDTYYLAPTGFKVIKEGATPQPIGASLVDEWLKENAGDDADYETWARWVQGAYDEVSGCIYWTFTDKASTNTDGLNNRMIIFNTKVPPERAWSTATIDAITIFPMEPQGEGDADPLRSFGLGIIAAPASTPVALEMIGGTSVNSLAAVLETGHIYDEIYKTHLQEVRMIGDGDWSLKLLTKLDALDDAEVTGSAITRETDGRFMCDSEARYHRLQLTSTANWTKATGVMAKQSPAGEY